MLASNRLNCCNKDMDYDQAVKQKKSLKRWFHRQVDLQDEIRHLQDRHLFKGSNRTF